MAEVDDFLGSVLPTLRDVEAAFHEGDAGPRLATWSHDDPVTLFGALLTRSGWAELAPAFEFLASRFSDFTGADYQVMAAGASGDLGYVAGIERTRVSVAGGPLEEHALRVTLVFRREDGEWKVVHRHADPAPGNDAAVRQLARFSGAPSEGQGPLP